MKNKYSTTFFLFTALATIQALNAATFQMAGSQAGELDGDGWAFRIPNLDGIEVVDDEVIYNSVDIAPKSPFDFGTITYDETQITGSGVECIALTNEMFTFDFSDYFQDVIDELAVIGTGAADVTLKDITGKGITFTNGIITSIDFTAEIEWVPTLNGFPQTIVEPGVFTPSPYVGTLTFSGNTFQFDLSRNTNYWFIGAADVEFYFDLNGIFDSIETNSETTAAAFFGTVDVPDENGWLFIDSMFEWVNAAHFPWNHHLTLGWLYSGDGNYKEGSWIWHPQLQWLWTEDAVYPWLWSQSLGTWIYHAQANAQPWYYNPQDVAWKPFAASQS